MDTKEQQEALKRVAEVIRNQYSQGERRRRLEAAAPYVAAALEMHLT